MTGLPPLADTHCHLCLREFADDVDEVLARSRRAGVDRILVPGIDLESSRKAVELAETHEEVYAAVGVHPHNAADYTSEVRRSLRRMAEAPKVVAIGEIGLDFYRNLSPRPAQERAFADQLDLATEVSLPVVVHNREATEAVLETLLPWATDRARPGVLHAYSSDFPTARQAAEAGLFFGIAGPITFTKAGAAAQIAASLPMDAVVTETDAPYLTPHPHRGHRNEPAHVALVAEALARIRARDIGEIRRMAWENADALFHWTHGTEDRHLL
jgi:TatD DNase family protein